MTLSTTSFSGAPAAEPRQADPVEAYKEAIARRYAGDFRPPMLALLAMTSRALPKPFHLALVALSGAGKSKAVDTAREFVPEEFIKLNHASSPMALVYDRTPLPHKALIMWEADSLPEDGSAGSALRSLIEEGTLVYEVVQKGSDGEFHTRRILKPGPTALITTSTKRPSPQWATRVLIVPVADTPEQTRQVMQAQAAAFEGRRPGPVPAWLVELQTEIQSMAPVDVLVPFASAVAAAMPDTVVRARRDLPQVLRAVQAVTLLRSRSRETNADGLLVATVDDYAVVYDLLAEVLAESLEASVTEGVRSAVEAIERILRDRGAFERSRDFGGGRPVEGVTLTEVARLLQRGKSTARFQLNRAVDMGYLDRVGKPGSTRQLYVLADELPAARAGLPTPEEVAAVFKS